MILYYALDTSTGKKTAVPAAGASIKQEVPSGLVNGTNNVFTLSNTPLSALAVMVYVNSLYLDPSKYSVNLTTKQITLTTPPAKAQRIDVAYWY